MADILRSIKEYIHIALCMIAKPLCFTRHPKYDKKYNVCICGIFKNEAPFLKEWIMYHKLIGIDHFYLYNNNSSDDYLSVLQEFIDDGSVTLTDWPMQQGQISAYKHFYDNYRKETQWFSYLDIDEFFCPKKDHTLLNWIKKHDKAPVILIYWKMFGSGGELEHHEDKLVTEQYTVSWPMLYSCGKCIINTDYEIASFDANIHHATRIRLSKWLFSFLPIDQFNQFQSGAKWGMKKQPEYDIQINHYWSKAWNIYNKKRLMTGDVFFKKNPKNNINYFLLHELNNTSSDHSIYRFILPLKWKMNGWKFD